jgi:hypothetical protein
MNEKLNEDELRTIEIALDLYSRDIDRILKEGNCGEDEHHYVAGDIYQVKEKLGLTNVLSNTIKMNNQETSSNKNVTAPNQGQFIEEKFQHGSVPISGITFSFSPSIELGEMSFVRVLPGTATPGGIMVLRNGTILGDLSEAQIGQLKEIISKMI